MKKTLTHLTGIVFLISMLIAGGCNPEVDTEGDSGGLEPASNEVKIFLKAVKRDGKKHLKMYDTNNRDLKVIDSLSTLVQPGSTVIWERAWLSRIKEIKKIGSKSGNGPIFIGDAHPIPDSKSFKLDIPQNVSSGDEEAYFIEFVDRKGIVRKIDPYLIIP